MIARLWLIFAVAMFAVVPRAIGHESRPAYLEIKETATGRYHLLWRTPLFSGTRLPVLLKLPEGIRDTVAPISQELPDSLIERRSIAADGAGLAGTSIRFIGLENTITDVLVRMQTLDGTHWTTLVHPPRPYVEIATVRGPGEVARDYLIYGLEHILFGADHLLFVFGLLLIVRDRWMLIKTVSAFTLAHSVTLALASFGAANIPAPPLNAMIALSILFLAPEIVRSWRGETSLTISRPWLVALGFGLLHGFGFATALTSAGLPRVDLPLALLAFNGGVELGQLGFIVLVLLCEKSFRRLEIEWPLWLARLPGYAVGSLGALWTIERTAILLGGLR